MHHTAQATRGGGWVWLGGALVLVLAVTMLPDVGVLVAPLASVVLGVGAARWARRDATATPRQANAAAAVAGLGAALASVVAFAVFGFALGSDPGLQEFIRGSEPYPEARIPYDWIAPLGGLGGAFVGVAVGLVNLALATLGGLLEGLLGGRAHAPRPA